MKETRSNFKILALMFCCAFIVLLTGCGMKTDLNISDKFAGERVIVCDEITNNDLLLTGKKVTDITDCLQKSCPEQMAFSCEYSDSGKTKAVYTFRLKFDSLDDYKSKVAAVIGRNPKVDYTYQSPEEQFFNSGFSLSEDFSSADLLSWVKNAIKSELGISKDISSFSDTVSITHNGTKFDNENLMSSRVKIDTIAAYKLESVNVDTIRYGDNDYSREVTLNIPKKTVEVLGKENIQKFLQTVTVEGASGQWLSDEGKLSSYRISIGTNSDKPGATADEIAAFTSKLFGSSSSFSYVKDESLYTAFSETGVLSEKISFERFPCENNGKCNAVFTYKNADASEFDSEKSTLSGGEKPRKGEGISEDNKTINLVYQKADSADIKLYSSTVYKLSEVDVVTEISGDDKVSQSLILAYPIDSGDYGAQFAASYFKRAFKDSGMTVEAGQFNGSGTQYAVTIATPADRVENVTAQLQKYIGEKNAIAISGEDKFKFYNQRNVSVTVDITELVKPSKYDGEIMYSFKGSGQAYDVGWTSDKAEGKNDVLMGEYRSGSFEHPISTTEFTITYNIRRVNVIFVLLVAALVIVVCGAIIMCVCWMVLRARRKNAETRLAAVNTMALVKLPDGTEKMMEITPEDAKNTVVIVPKNDDGLDEDDDDPENVWLFGTALKLFAVIGAVLFFLSYATVTWTDLLTKTKSISGLDLVNGTTIMDNAFDGSYTRLVLLVAPLIIFAVLCLRKYIPKVLANLSVIAISAFQIWYLLGLPGVLEENLNAFAAAMSKKIMLEMDWAYNYSVMIYVILLLGGVILMVVDSWVSARQRIIEREIDQKKNADK